MKYSLLCALFVLLPMCATYSTTTPPFDIKYFNQHVTHFGTNKRMYQQRYFISDVYYRPGGPLLFYTGGEATIGYLPYTSGAVLWEFAEEFGGLVVYAEHRYYGMSLPFGASSWTRENIQYLKIEEALQDYVTLIKALKDDNNITGPVVSIGGSYPGSLTSYMRMNHPDVVDMALSASAPILLWPGRLSQYLWFKQVTESFTRKNPKCAKLVRDAFVSLKIHQNGGTAGQKYVQNELGLCVPMQNTTYLEQFVINAFSGEAMENLPWKNDGGVPPFPLDAECEHLISANVSGSLLSKLRPILNWAYGGTDGKCLDVKRTFVPCADPTGCGVGPTGWSWDYQCCTEIMHPAGSNNKTDMFPPFPYDIDGLDQYCMSRWGKRPSPTHIFDTLIKPHLNHTSRLIFSNGLLDPWHVGGVLHNIGKSVVAVLIADGAHHDDLWATHPNEPPSLTKARKTERDLLRQWISDWKEERSL